MLLEKVDNMLHEEMGFQQRKGNTVRMNQILELK